MPIEVRVKGNLNSIIADLDALKKKAEEVQKELAKGSDDVSEQLSKNKKKNEGYFDSIRGFGRRTADQLRRDFRSLASLESLQAGLKLSGQFKNAITETVQLSDAIRKLGSTFGKSEKQFASFQQYLTQGLGEIGLSSDVAARTLEALAKTPVRSSQAVLEYSQKAGMLASIGREPGKEGDIAGALAQVIRARGGNVENLGQMRELAESVRRVTIQTGEKPSQVLSNMEALFARMPEDLRKALSSKGLANLAAAQAVGGPNATKFLEEILGQSPIARMAFEAQGGKGIFTDQGLDVEKFRSFAQSIIGRVGGDPRLAAQTLGLSEDAAEGFVRLAESLDLVAAAQDKINKSTGSLNETYRASMGLAESFKANINRVKANLSGFLEPIIQDGTGLLSKAAGSDIGSTAVAGGGAVLAALLAGGGLKGIGGTLTKGAAASALTGKDVQPVYVVNASEFGGLGAAAGAAGGGMLGKAGAALGAAGLAVGAGVAAREGLGYLSEAGVPMGPSAQTVVDSSYSAGGEFFGDAVKQMTNAIIALNNLLGANYAPVQRSQQEVKVTVESKSPMLKASSKPARGPSVGN